MKSNTKPHSNGGSPICTKHDRIQDLAIEVQQIVEACLQDGQNMEEALLFRREEIKEKDARIKELEDEVARLKKDLQDQIDLYEANHR